MPNPFNALNPSNPMRAYDFGYLRNLYQSLSGKNPMQVIGQMAMRNPQMQPIMQALRGGQNPQQLFRSLCQQRGINPDEFIGNIVGNNGRNPVL